LTVELDLDNIKMYQQAKYLGHGSFNSNVTVRTLSLKHTDTDTQPTGCSI